MATDVSSDTVDTSKHLWTLKAALDITTRVSNVSNNPIKSYILSTGLQDPIIGKSALRCPIIAAVPVCGLSMFKEMVETYINKLGKNRNPQWGLNP